MHPDDRVANLATAIMVRVAGKLFAGEGHGGPSLQFGRKTGMSVSCGALEAENGGGGPLRSAVSCEEAVQSKLGQAGP
jgi:hypothetical protein